MVGMWLTVGIMFVFLMIGAYFFLGAITPALNSQDASKIDPIPKENNKYTSL